MGARRNNIWLKERIDQDRVKASKVDRDKRIIRDVKILGFESSNRRRYTKPCLEAAPAKYERCKVKANHPRKAGDQRDVDDTLGWLEGIELREDGLYAREFHYLESHPLAARICEAAERNGELFGFSHNIQGDTEDAPDGYEIVHRIESVRSVDLVDDPATTHGLFEERRVTTKIKLRPLFEGLKLPGGTKAQKNRAKLVKRLFESGMMDGDMDSPIDAVPDETAPVDDHKTALKGGFEAMIAKIVQDCLAGGDCKAGVKKIGELLGMHSKIADPGEEEIEEQDDDDADDGKDRKESKELKLLRAEKKGRQLCEAAGVAADSVLLESLAALPDEASMKRLIEREKSRGQSPASRRPEPRAGSGGGKQTPADEVADFMAGARN